MRAKLMIASSLVAVAVSFVGCTGPADDTNKHLTPSTTSTTPMPSTTDTAPDTNTTNN